MDIRSDSYPFMLKFIQVSDSFSTEHVVEEFVYDIEKLYEMSTDKIIKVRENISLMMHFICADPTARIFMDGLDMLSPDLTEEELGVAYLSPQKAPIILFGYKDYPMIPGLYEIKVVVNEKIFYSKIEIIPTLLEKQEWKIMKNQLENTVNGLAQDFIRKNISVGNYDNEYTSIPNNLLYKFIIINKFATRIISTLQELSTTANYRIKKTYKITSIEKVREIDSKTFSYQQLHPECKNYYKVPIKTINFDLPENRYIKRLIMELKRLIQDFVVAINNYKTVIEREIFELETYNNMPKISMAKKRGLAELKNYEQKANRINFSIKVIEDAEWYKEVSLDTNMTIVPSTLLIDARYRTLYQLNRELKKEDIKCIMDSKYSYQWKRTDKLYEMWCFLEIHKFMISKKKSFIPISGWIYDCKFYDDQMLIPVLLPNTTITYEKDDVIIRFIYDGIMPGNSAASDEKNNPLYSRSDHNRPDGRIDIYKKNIYAGSILMDFKYRKPNRFWNYGVESKNQSSGMKQLIAYSDSCRSSFLYGHYISMEERRRTRPVIEVWALYPKDSKKEESHLYDDAGLRLIKVCPGKENDLYNIINKNIENVLDAFNDVMDNYSIKNKISH